MIRSFCIGMAALLAALCGPLSAQEPGEVTYTVQRGDTLVGIAARYLRSTSAIPLVQRINRVRNPRRLPIGTPLKLPRALLRFEDVVLEVAAFSGPVSLAGATPSVGARLAEGAIVTTGPNGFVTFRSSFGGRISLPSNSRARLIRARRYVLGGTLDVDFAIEDGRGSATSPALKGQDLLQMRTPRAVTAVRGTDFRVAFDAGLARSITEVTQGLVAVAAGTDTIAAIAGFGVASAGDGLAPPEALLPAPALVEPGAIQTEEQLRFTVDPGPQARAHRFEIARDAGFVDVVSGVIAEGREAVFEPLPNGRYFMRARAISASGIEGFSESYSFRRKRLGAEASIGQSDEIDGFVFQWLPEGDGNVTFAFQLWRDGDAAKLIVDEAGLSSTALVLTDLAPGVYQWRVAAVEAEPEGLLKVWGPTQKLTISQ